MDDKQAMAQAVALGEQGRRTSAPNPWVGCLLTQGGGVVGRGFHARAGEPHAEVHALREAGSLAHGATAYVTLEPCSHYGRTGPCADALIQAGVRRVVVAQLDPDSNVAGRGVQRLRDAGVAVEVGEGAQAVAASLSPYLHQRRTGRAYTLVKAAASVDGRTAAADGTSQWITGRAARADVHNLRAESQAVLVGAGTALVDRPTLTARDATPPAVRQPLRVLLDGTGRVPAEGPLFETRLAPTLVITSEQAPAERVEEWLSAGADVERVERTAEGVCLRQALAVLGQRGVLQVLVEGGAAVYGALLRERLINRFVLYVGAVVLGAAGHPLFVGASAPTIAAAPRWRLLGTRQVGADVRLDYEPCEEDAA